MQSAGGKINSSRIKKAGQNVKAGGGVELTPKKNLMCGSGRKHTSTSTTAPVGGKAYKNNRKNSFVLLDFPSKFPYRRRRHHRYLLCPLCAYMYVCPSKNILREKSCSKKCFVIMWTFQSLPTPLPRKKSPSLHFFLLQGLNWCSWFL